MSRLKAKGGIKEGSLPHLRPCIKHVKVSFKHSSKSSSVSNAAQQQKQSSSSTTQTQQTSNPYGPEIAAEIAARKSRRNLRRSFLRVGLCLSIPAVQTVRDSDFWLGFYGQNSAQPGVLLPGTV